MLGVGVVEEHIVLEWVFHHRLVTFLFACAHEQKEEGQRREDQGPKLKLNRRPLDVDEDEDDRYGRESQESNQAECLQDPELDDGGLGHCVVVVEVRAPHHLEDNGPEIYIGPSWLLRFLDLLLLFDLGHPGSVSVE